MSQILKMLRMSEVVKRYGRGRSTTYSDVKAGLMVPPVELGARCSAVPEHELNSILAARLAGQPDDEVRALVRRLVADRANQVQRAA